MANKCELKIGETLDIDFNRVEEGVAVPLTGVTVTSKLKHKKFGEWDLVVTVTDAEAGQMEMVLDAAITASMLEGEYLWEVTYTHESGLVEKFPKNNEQIIFELIKGA